MKTPDYIKALVAPVPQKSTGRKVWSIDLETVWLPFFTATNVQGNTNISKESLGAPLRLQRDKDGMPRFSPSGRPVIRVNAELNGQIRFARENMVFQMLNFAANVQKQRAEDYKAEIESCIKAGDPIIEKDRLDIEIAVIEAAKKAKLAEAMEQAASDAVKKDEQKASGQELEKATA
ncbi:MAG: hypothetical protein PHV74_08435 [Dehalococcoidia bacterium]|nr:hypothetical protein [Dehalococcoidia bacterium]